MSLPPGAAPMIGVGEPAQYSSGHRPWVYELDTDVGKVTDVARGDGNPSRNRDAGDLRIQGGNRAPEPLAMRLPCSGRVSSVPVEAQYASANEFSQRPLDIVF